jgi:hypothetical protein
MGYYTDYQIEAEGFKTRDEAEFFAFKLVQNDYVSGSTRFHYGGNEELGFNVQFEVRETKWYGYSDDLRTVSLWFPDVTIDVEGSGEENGDQWRHRFRNGEQERVNAVISFPDFQVIR